MQAWDDVCQTRELISVIGHAEYICVFKSAQLEGLHVGDSLYLSAIDWAPSDSAFGWSSPRKNSWL